MRELFDDVNCQNRFVFGALDGSRMAGGFVVLLTSTLFVGVCLFLSPTKAAGTYAFIS